MRLLLLAMCIGLLPQLARESAASEPASLRQRRDQLLQEKRQTDFRISAAGLADLSAGESKTIADRLQLDRESLAIEVIAKRAALAELDKQIKQCKEDLATRLKNDPVIAELEKLVVPLDKVAQRRRSSPEAYPEPDIERAEIEAGMQHVQLLERREHFGPDDPLLTSLTRDRAWLATDLAEIEARARVVTERMHVLQTLQQDLERDHALQGDISALNAEIRMAELKHPQAGLPLLADALDALDSSR